MGCTAYQIRESGSALIHQWNATDGDDFVASRPQFSCDAATGSVQDQTWTLKFEERFAGTKELICLERNIKSIEEESRVTMKDKFELSLKDLD